MDRSTGALGLLRENADFRKLWLSRNISFIGDSLAGIALVLFVAADQDTGIAVALLLLVGDFTPSLLSPFLGTLSDRLDRKRLMIGSELAQGAVIATIALLLAGLALSNSGNLLTGLAWSVPAAVAFQIVRGLGISAIDVGVNTIVQRIVPQGMQGRAFANLYGLVGIAVGLAYIVGGPLLDTTGPRVVLVAGGLGGLIATSWMAVRLLRAEPQPAPDDEPVTL